MDAGRRVSWTPEARRTLEEVLAFVSRDSTERARLVLEQALQAAESLAVLAERGRVVPELSAPSIREVFVHRYRLMYRVSADTIVILAFIHGARDFNRWRGR